MLFSQINLGSSASRQVAVLKFLGCYFPTGEFSCGRQVFKHGDYDDFIMKVRPAEVYWSIFAKNVKVLKSFAASSLSPGDCQDRISPSSEGGWSFREMNSDWKKSKLYAKCFTSS